MIICSISTIPGRINGLIEVLNCIKNQSLLPHKIFITIAEIYPRINQTYPNEDYNKLQSYILSFPILTEIIRIKEDIGPIVKLTTPLDYVNNVEEDVIVILDDDTLIFKETIELLYTSYKKYGDAVYGFIGVMNNNPSIFHHGEHIFGCDILPIDMLGGYRGVLYPIKLIYNDLSKWVQIFINEHQKQGLITLHDDHIFNYFLTYKKIKKYIVKIPTNNGELKYRYIHNTDGIFGSNNHHESLMLTVDINEKINNGIITV